MASVPHDAALAAVDTDTTNDEILLAATNHDVDALKKLLRTGSARIQDPETGFSPLHAAIAACEPDDDVNTEAAGEGDAVHGTALSEESALATIQSLFENGAIWNELDNNDETPGCLALRLGLKQIYDAIVSAGVRAELLFNRLDEYEPLADDVDDAEEELEEQEDITGFEPTPTRIASDRTTTEPPVTASAQVNNISTLEGFEPTPTRIASDRSIADAPPNGAPTFEGFEPAPNPSYKIEDGPAAEGAQSSEVPVVIQAYDTSVQPSDLPVDESAAESTAAPILSNPNVNSEDYLRSELTYSAGRLLDSDKNAVMMDWETEIMKASADKLCPRKGLRTMNIGFGMGIVDSMFVANDPAMHHIVEAHPAVMKRMREQGWYNKPNVTVHEGRWQEVLPKLVEQGVVLDALYYDTYAEHYKDLKELFTEYVIALLDSKGLFGFYNGLGADRQVCYDVYTKVAELDLYDAGLDVEWTTLAVPDLAQAWDGIRRPYWVVETYRLPTCRFVG